MGNQLMSALVAELRLPADTQALQDWNHRMRILLPLANEWALLDTLGLLLEDEFYTSRNSFYLDPVSPWCNESSILTNGTTFFVCGDWMPNQHASMNTSCKSHSWLT